MDRVVKFGKYFSFNKVTLTLFDMGFSGAFNHGGGGGGVLMSTIIC